MFGKTTVMVEKTVAEKSADALGMFRTALESLRGINNEAEIIKQQNLEVIKAREIENKELEKVAAKNLKVVTNIEKLIGA